MPTGLRSAFAAAARRLAERERRAASGDDGTAPPRFVPYPGPQTHALESPADELYFGGAAGGGKTRLIIGASLLRHRNAIILRRDAAQTKGIGEAIRTMMRPGDRWKNVGNGGELRTADGRQVEVGGCQRDDDWMKYQGRPYDLYSFDELPTFSEKQYTTLIAWNRVADMVRHPDQRCRVIGAGNPPTNPEGEWVLKRWRAWLDPTAGRKAGPCELRWYAQIDGAEEEFADGTPFDHKGTVITPLSRTFIPARVEDNPGAIASGYAAKLEQLPEPLRSQMRWGDFGVTVADDRWQLIPTDWIRAAQRRWAENRDSPVVELSAIGVDVAMSVQPGDQTVLAARHGRRVAPLVKRPGTATPDGSAVVALIVAVRGASTCPVNIDAGNVGKSAVDAAKAGGLQGIVPVMFGGGTDFKDPTMRMYEFPNERAGMYWHLRNLLDPKGDPETRLELPPDPELTTDLCATRYRVSGSKIYIEDKQEIRKRIGRSPDAADAVALACRPARKVAWAFG